MQSVISQTGDPGVTSLSPARSHTFMETDHEIISKVILLLPLIQEGLLSVTSKVCAHKTSNKQKSLNPCPVATEFILLLKTAGASDKDN